MSETTELTEPVFGIYEGTIDPGDFTLSTASRTGLILYPIEGHPLFNEGFRPRPFVVSFVNGCMCHNPLGEFVCSVNFDETMGDLLDKGAFRLPQEGEPFVAHFNTKTLVYETPKAQA